MRVFESISIHAKEAFELRGEERDTISPFEAQKGLVIADPTDGEWDAILNIRDGLDPTGLRGFMARLLPDKKDSGDPDFVNLISVPCNGQVIRHQDRYYLVKVVLQSSNCSLAIFCQKLSQKEFWSLTGVA